MQNASKLIRLIVRNIGCIGNEGITVELDNVVCLVGRNNAGKSTVLKAYALAQGSETFSPERDRCLQSSDDELSEVELEVHIPKGIGNVDEKWKQPEGDFLIVKSRWQWKAPDFRITRSTWDPQINDWSPGEKAGGADNVFKSRLPRPIRIGSLQDAESMEKVLAAMALAPLNTMIESERSTVGSQLHAALGSVADQLKDLGNAHENRFNEISERVATGFRSVFPNLGVKINVQPAPIVPKIESGLRVSDGKAETTIPQQGTGARRALFWAMLQVHNELLRLDETRAIHRKLLQKQLTDAEKAKAKKPADADTVEACRAQLKAFDDGGPMPNDADDPALPGYLLLIDEPENALHPMAARAAQKHLYKLAESPDWQVMMTTHSPYFINPFEDHTTIIRLERDDEGEIASPKTYRSDEITFQGEEKQWLHAMQQLDPSLAEIFFGSYPILVEGDTEHAAFIAAILEKQHELANKVTVVRARGKAILPALISMMGHFKIDFGVLHDCDPPFKKDGSSNGMWTQNNNIRIAVEAARKKGIKVRHRVSVPDFERYLGYDEESKDKPLLAYIAIGANPDLSAKVQILLKDLMTSEQHEPFAPQEMINKQYLDLIHDVVIDWAKKAGIQESPRFKGK
ncbi:AAA family ATPase [uncultured Xanthomonas sp.]|uniref:ATP-dependent nuclease n=1 Tax=uncultured Xanthomonas sp. TaxID=152831 RepID=UPI0025DB9371|nr:AAA family ATPase [uncultured Xanthomonas sp.]